MYYKLKTKMHSMLTDFRKDRRGVTAVEYAIIAVVMSAIVLAAFQNDTLKNSISNALEKVETNLSSATSTTTSRN